MNLHSGARSCPASRAFLIERIQDGSSVTATAAALGVSRRTAYKWLARYALEGAAGLQDRSSRPRSMPTMLTIEEVCCIRLLRESRMTIARIATGLEIPRSTVARVLKQRGLNRLTALDDQTPPQRYTRRHPGELLHLDVKKLGRITGFYGHRITGNRSRRRRGAGWDFVHVAIDDASRLAYAEVLPNEQGDTSAAFLARAVAWFKRTGIRVRRVLTDNGSGYVSACFGLACSQLRIRHLRTRPYRPCTNGKAERFIQTLLREWAYVRPYRTSGLRARVLPVFLAYYNNERPHGSLGGRSPISRIRPRCEQPPETPHLGEPIAPDEALRQRLALWKLSLEMGSDVYVGHGYEVFVPHVRRADMSANIRSHLDPKATQAWGDERSFTSKYSELLRDLRSPQPLDSLRAVR